MTGTGWSPPTAASSPSVMPGSTARGAATAERSDSRDGRPPTATGTGWWPPTGASSASVMPRSAAVRQSSAQPADRRDGRHPRAARGTGWWAPTAGSSASATPPSGAVRGASSWTSRSWAWLPRPGATGRRHQTVASSASEAPPSMDRCRSSHPPDRRGSPSTAIPRLPSQAQDFAFLASNSGASVRVRTFPGTATCDFLPSMAADAQDWQPTAAVLAFSGDAFTPCMAGYQLGRRSTSRNTKPTPRRRSRSSGPSAPRSFWSACPLTRPPVSVRTPPPSIRSTNRWPTSNIGVTYDDAGQAVMANGQFTWTLPCLSGEPCTGPAGTNVVRAPDGVHFCPDGKTTLVGGLEECDVYSSGAFRFAAAMLAPALTPPSLP